MIDELLKELRRAVGGARDISEGAKAELLRHVDAMEASARESGTAADSRLSPGAAAPDAEHPLKHPLKGLVMSFEGFEASHPDITALVNRIAVALSNMGI